MPKNFAKFLINVAKLSNAHFIRKRWLRPSREGALQYLANLSKCAAQEVEEYVFLYDTISKFN